MALGQIENVEDLDDLVHELQLGSARGARRSVPVQIERVRELTTADIPLLLNPPVVSAPLSIPQIKHQHHQIAALLARGVSNAEISHITGYSPSFISVLKHAPDMQELMEYYKAQAEERVVDGLARLKALGIASVEELQQRINEAPEKFTVAQLTELIELGVLQTQPQGKGAGTPFAGLNIQLNFKSPDALAEAGLVIDQPQAKALR